MSSEAIDARDIELPTALILCGGLGTRLRSRLPDRPKALATVDGRPLLAWLLDGLAGAGVARTVLATGHLSEPIEQAFTGEWDGMEVVVSREPRPLGTAGALGLALPRIDTDAVLVLNGDSYCAVEPRRVVGCFRERRATALIVLVEVADTSRYGRVELEADDRVRAFVEKDAAGGPGWINAGVYCLSRRLLEELPAGRAVSLEREVFPRLVDAGLYGLPVAAPFVDIGTPEALDAAQGFFSRLQSEVER